MATLCDTDSVKTKANRKQVCFSDKELEIYGQFLADKGKFSTYVKKLIEQDFNNSQPTQNNSSDLDSKFDELKQFIAEQLKESRQAPITIQMQGGGVIPAITPHSIATTGTGLIEEPKNEVKTEINKAQVKNKAASFNKFR